MPLSKKYYQGMAEALGSPKVKSKGDTINALASYLKYDNPRFNREKFVQEIAYQRAFLSTENGSYTGRYKKMKVGGRIIQIPK